MRIEVPINFDIAKLVKFGTQPVQFQVGRDTGLKAPTRVRMT